MQVNHEFDAYYNTDSRILILGSIPSVKSRIEGFYYAHPKNRFWWTLATIYQEQVPRTLDEKKNFLKQHHIALWDVIACCTINGSSDASIKDIEPNDIRSLLKKCPIKKIYTTGKKAKQLYDKYCYPDTKVEAIYLPSTSPANCPKNIEQILLEAYQDIKKETEI